MGKWTSHIYFVLQWLWCALLCLSSELLHIPVTTSDGGNRGGELFNDRPNHHCWPVCEGHADQGTDRFLHRHTAWQVRIGFDVGTFWSKRHWFSWEIDWSLLVFVCTFSITQPNICLLCYTAFIICYGFGQLTWMLTDLNKCRCLYSFDDLMEVEGTCIRHIWKQAEVTDVSKALWHSWRAQAVRKGYQVTGATISYHIRHIHQHLSTNSSEYDLKDCCSAHSPTCTVTDHC